MQLLKPDQWQRLIDRLGEIDNPEVPTEPSDVLAAGQAQAKGKSGGTGAAATSRGESGL